MSKLNSVFAKKPFLATLVISALVSLIVLLVSLDYRGGEAAVEIVDSEDISKNIVDTLPKEVRVDLSGAVRTPGVYMLDSGSRLSDLISLGGGFTSDASTLWVSKNLNLSQGVTDGEKIYIPFEWDIAGLEETADTNAIKALSLGATSGTKLSSLVSQELKKMNVGSSESSSSSSSGSTSLDSTDKVNVNNATSDELDALPGVGPAYAGRIIESRPYTSYDDFKERSNLSAALVESLKSLITF